MIKFNYLHFITLICINTIKTNVKYTHVNLIIQKRLFLIQKRYFVIIMSLCPTVLLNILFHYYILIM